MKNIQSNENCRYFRPKVDVLNPSRIGTCSHPNSGINVTKNVASTLCSVCHLHKEKGR
jgi:hypothetical protein